MGLVALLGCACAASATGPGRFPVETITVPEDVARYSTDAAPDGAMGGAGAEQLEARIAAALAERGHKAQADGALGATASWGLKEVHEGRTVDAVGADTASRHFGFSGILLGFVAFDTHGQELWREQLERIPSNMPITRYGIRLSPGGSSAAVVFGSVELTHAPIARNFEPGESVTLQGEIAPRFSFGHVYLTKPDGSVDEQRFGGRGFNVSLPLPATGKYRLEVMGDGATGPVVVSNVPLYVGVPEPPVTGVTGTVATPAQAEERMLGLLNEARRTAGLGPVQADAELRRLAMLHSEDMVEHNFFSHVSPSTGAPQDRARRSGILVSLFGENIAAANTPEAAHEGLMASPGHRANMLRADFTHVGIGAALGPNGLVVTLAFGRRATAESLPQSAAQVVAAIADLRAKQGLPAAADDPIYGASAQAGAVAFAAGGAQQDVNQAISATMQREVNRYHTSRPAACTLWVDLLDLAQLKDMAPLSQPGLRRFGIGAELRQDDKGSRLATVFMLEGVSCQ